MEEVEAAVKGVVANVCDFNDAADGHLVNQQFEYGLVLVRLSLPGCGLEILRERLAADVAAPAGISNSGLTETGICPWDVNGQLT